MATVAPFAGVHYDPAQPLSALLAPPFDVIGHHEHRRLTSGHAHNITHLTLGDSVQRRSYPAIAARLRRWIAEGVLTRDSQPAFYAYCQEWAKDGHRLKFWGFLALLRLEPFGRRHIFPHEAVLPAPVADRLRIMEHSRANLEPIMTLYRQPEDAMELLYQGLEGLPPLLAAVVPGGGRHRVWRLGLARTRARIQRTLRRRKLFIADGHHRYTAAWLFRQRHRRLPGAQWIMTLIANTEQPGLRIGPIHRAFTCDAPVTADLPRSLERFGRVERLGRRPDAAAMHPARHAIGFYARATGAWRLHLPAPAVTALPREGLEVVQLHSLLPQAATLRAVTFEKDPLAAAAAARHDRRVLAVFLPPISSGHICAIAFGGETLPQKSTFFLPKPLSGLVLRLM